MTDPIWPWLAEIAAGEVATREARYPALVEAGTLERTDADADLAAWRAIAGICGSNGMTSERRDWHPLELAASRALIRGQEVVARNPGHRAHLERRDAIEAIHARIVHQRRLAAMRPTPTPLPLAGGVGGGG
jgi:hypothetical protein